MSLQTADVCFDFPSYFAFFFMSLYSHRHHFLPDKITPFPVFLYFLIWIWGWGGDNLPFLPQRVRPPELTMEITLYEMWPWGGDCLNCPCHSGVRYPASTQYLLDGKALADFLLYLNHIYPTWTSYVPLWFPFKIILTLRLSSALSEDSPLLSRPFIFSTFYSRRLPSRRPCSFLPCMYLSPFLHCFFLFSLRVCWGLLIQKLDTLFWILLLS